MSALKCGYADLTVSTRSEIMTNPHNENLLTTREAAARIRHQPQTLRRWRMLGRGPAFFRLAGRALYDPADLQKWLNSHPPARDHGHRTRPLGRQWRSVMTAPNDTRPRRTRRKRTRKTILLLCGKCKIWKRYKLVDSTPGEESWRYRCPSCGTEVQR